MSEENGGTGFFAELSTASKVLGALVAAASGYSAIAVSQLNYKVGELTEERRFASLIMQRYDDVVSAKDTTTDVRLARLAGLITLADLVSAERRELRENILKAISRQAEAYESALQTRLASTSTPAQQAVVNGQLDQLDAIQQAAQESLAKLAADDAPEPEEAVTTAAAPAANPASRKPAARFANYRFDIFWCSGTPRSEEANGVANALLALRASDPDATGRWRIRPLDPVTNQRSGYQESGYTIRISSDDELEPARQLVALARAQPGGPVFGLKRTASQTPGYLSAFVCPAAKGKREVAAR